MGRYMSPDWSSGPEPVPYASLGDPQSLNLYSYVRNNPLSRSDEDGHCDDDGGSHGRTWCFFHALGFVESNTEAAARIESERTYLITRTMNSDGTPLTDAQVYRLQRANATQIGQLYTNVLEQMAMSGHSGEAPGQLTGEIYEPNPKHGATAKGNVSAEPTNGDAVLKDAVPFKNTSSAKVGVDPSTGEYVMFRETRPGVYHGYAVKSFNDLPNEAKAALQAAGKVSQKGAIR
jgi:hypothetical protein